jgi:O-succinylbenzoate synthase
MIIRLEDETGRIGYGEIAPIPWFGSETLEDALFFCRSLDNSITEEKIFLIPDTLPACSWAFESAIENLRLGEFIEPNNLNFSYLLPTGQEAIERLPEILTDVNTDTFKWKIGIESPDKELKLLEKLSSQLPDGIKIRLDANGGLSLDEARDWLRVTDRLSCIEFIEQPLPPERFEEMVGLERSFSTSIALDESVSKIRQIEAYYRKGWRGIFVIKPSIMGSIRRFRELRERYPLDTVFSSALETSIGRRSALRLAVEWSRNDRALGFGVGQWFADNETDFLQQLWKTL